MSLVKSSSINAFSVAAKLASALVLNKILAAYIGPSGYAVIGQFQNAASIFVSLAGGVMAIGVTKLTAQHFDDIEKQHFAWKTVAKLSLILSLIIIPILILLDGRLNQIFLKESGLDGVFIWLALCLPMLVWNNLILGVINGKKEIKLYVIGSISASIISTLIIGLFSIYFGIYGALIAISINSAFILIVLLYILKGCQWFRLKYFIGSINNTVIRELFGFGMIGLTSAIAAPVSYMVIRNLLTDRLGSESAGYWQACWKISEMYLFVITTTLATYYLPRIAEIKKIQELKREIFKTYLIVLPVTIIGAVAVFLSRDFIINILFSTEFLPMRELFGWQLFGDVIKIASWILAYVMIGRAMFKYFIITEVIFTLTFILMAYKFIEIYGLIGVSIAYAANYILYLITLSIIIKKELDKRFNN